MRRHSKALFAAMRVEQDHGQDLRVPSFDRNVIERGSYERYFRAHAATASGLTARCGPAPCMYSTSSSSSATAPGGATTAAGATAGPGPQYAGGTTA